MVPSRRTQAGIEASQTPHALADSSTLFSGNARARNWELIPSRRTSAGAAASHDARGLVPSSAGSFLGWRAGHVWGATRDTGPQAGPPAFSANLKHTHCVVEYLFFASISTAAFSSGAHT